MAQTTISQYLECAVNASRLAGEYIVRHLGSLSQRDIGQKKAADFVTRVDKESEKIIITAIREQFPEHAFCAEESLQDTTGEYRWIIDPLDGTTNFIHGYPVFSVSIALEYRGEVVVGTILDPLRDELFTALKGVGAFLNGVQITVSDLTDFEDSLITTGFPFRQKDLIDPYLELFRRLFFQVSDLRRAGSAALDLSSLACGRCDGFFEIGLSSWDIAAGSLLIVEAGGLVTDFSGGGDYLSTGNIVAGTQLTHDKILQEVKAVFHGLIER